MYNNSTYIYIRLKDLSQVYISNYFMIFYNYAETVFYTCGNLFLDINYFPL